MNVCEKCFNDLEIKKFIETTSQAKGKCDFCQEIDVKLLELNELLDFFSEFINIFVADDELGIPISELIHRDWGIFSLETNHNKLLNEILQFLTDSGIESADTHVSYMEDIIECVDYWDILKEDLKWKRRFLTDIDAIFNLGWDSFFNSKADLPEDKILYRARVHGTEFQEAYPINRMASPPKEHATGGRANPDGIPYLYLSEDYQTTLYETRVTYLDDVSIGSFKMVDGEEVVLVDFTDFSSPFLHMGSIIENAKSRLLQEKISFDLSKPIRRYDSHLEYLPTQFICEFIRYITGAEGIIFSSSLHEGGINYVMFSDEKFECVGVEKYQVTSVVIDGVKWEDSLPKF